MSNKWSSEDFITFLDVFKKYKILWNVNAVDYMSKGKRENAYERLIIDLEHKGFTGLTVGTVKKKVKIIKDIHRHEFFKVVKSKNSGGGDVYKPRLIWYDKADAFLGTVVASRSSTSTAGNSSVNQEEEDDEQNGRTPSPPPVIRQPTLKKRPSQNLPPPTAPPPPKRLQSEHNQTKYFEIAVNNLNDYVSSRTTADTEDEYDMFAKHIAAQLRTLPTRNFVILQEKIQALVSAERLSCLQDATPSPDDSVD